MKKIITGLLALLMLLSAAGCTEKTQEPSTAATTPATESPTTAPEKIVYILHNEQKTDTVCADDGTEIFKCTYPQIQIEPAGTAAQQAIDPDLKERIEAFKRDAAYIKDYARQEDHTTEHWMPFYATLTYTDVRFDHQVLSLYGTAESYSGEAHPTRIDQAVTYDLATGDQLRLNDLLAEDYSSAQLIEAICVALEPHSKDLYPNYSEVIADRYGADLESITDWYLTDTALCFFFSPYDIAPSYLGTVTAQLPFDHLPIDPTYLPTP